MQLHDPPQFPVSQGTRGRGDQILHRFPVYPLGGLRHPDAFQAVDGPFHRVGVAVDVVVTLPVIVAVLRLRQVAQRLGDEPAVAPSVAQLAAVLVDTVIHEAIRVCPALQYFVIHLAQAAQALASSLGNDLRLEARQQP